MFTTLEMTWVCYPTFYSITYNTKCVCSHKCPKHCEGMEKEELCEEEAFVCAS